MLNLVARNARTMAPRGARMASSSSSSSAASSLPIPPKLATPQSVKGPGGSSASMDEVVSFYKALPKGEVKLKKGPFSNPGNGRPLVIGIATLFLVGYTMDYHMHLKYHKNGVHH